MDVGLAPLLRVHHRDDRRQRLVFHLHQRSTVLGLGWRGTDHHGDRLADVPDLAFSQNRPIGRLETRHFGSRAQRPKSDEIVREID